VVLRLLKRVLDKIGLVYEDRTTPIPDDAQPATMLISSYSPCGDSSVLFGIIGGTYKNVYRVDGMSFCEGCLDKNWKWLIEEVSGTPSMIYKPGWFNCPLHVAQKAYITASLKGILIHDSTDLEAIGGFEFFPTVLKNYHAKLSLIMTAEFTHFTWSVLFFLHFVINIFVPSPVFFSLPVFKVSCPVRRLCTPSAPGPIFLAPAAPPPREELSPRIFHWNSYADWCLLFVLIRHGEGGGTSLRAGLIVGGFYSEVIINSNKQYILLRRLGKETLKNLEETVIYCLLELDMLCDCVKRGGGDHSPLTTASILRWRRRSDILIVGGFYSEVVLQKREAE